MGNDTLGDRMKSYEEVAERRLTPRVPVIARLDGNCFHTWTRGLDKPYDDTLRACMEHAACKVCREISGARFAYVQSDEISILIIDYQDLKTEGWFGYRANKMQSVAASICASHFNEIAFRLMPDHCKKKGLAYFDARFFNVPKEDVLNCFLWRQRDCEKNSISSLAQAHFSHKELHGKNSSQMQDMLMLQKNINWNDVVTRFKRGTAIYKVHVTMPNTHNPDGAPAIRHKWIADYEMPILTQDREYVNKWLEPETVVEGFPPFNKVFQE